MKRFDLHIAVKLLLYWYIFIFISTETLSYLHLLERNYILLSEVFFWAIFLFFYRQEILQSFQKIGFRSKSILLTLLLFLLTFIQGFFSAPNSTDSMVYHLPRIMYWMQEKTLAQDVFRNISHDFKPPFGEYILLHLYSFFGDRLLFLSQWIGYVITVIISGLIASHLGANKKNTNLIMLLVATIPVAIMQATSVEIELVVTVLVAYCTYFALKLRPTSPVDYVLLGVGLGLGILTKPNFLFYSILPEGILLIKFLEDRRRVLTLLPLTLLIILLIQARFIFQELSLYNKTTLNSVYTGYTSQNFTPSAILSNLIKNTMLHIPIPLYTKEVGNLILFSHRFLGIDVNDCATTFCDPNFKFRLVKAIYPQEDIASNSLHLLLIVIAGLLLVIQIFKRRISFLESYIYLLSILSFIAFAAFIKWQPFHSRFHIPFFVVGTISSVLVLSKFRKGIYILNIATVLSVLLAFLLIFFNVLRPFISYNLFYNSIKSFATPLSSIPQSFLITPYGQQYYNSRTYWYNPYLEVMGYLNNLHPTEGAIAFDLMDNFEYPLWVLLKKDGFNLQIISTSQISSDTIVISTSQTPYALKGYTTQCFKTKIEYGYACLSKKI